MLVRKWPTGGNRFKPKNAFPTKHLPKQPFTAPNSRILESAVEFYADSVIAWDKMIYFRWDHRFCSKYPQGKTRKACSLWTTIAFLYLYYYYCYYTYYFVNELIYPKNCPWSKKKKKENTNRTFLLIERFFRDTPKDNGVMMFFRTEIIG